MRLDLKATILRLKIDKAKICKNHQTINLSPPPHRETARLKVLLTCPSNFNNKTVPICYADESGKKSIISQMKLPVLGVRGGELGVTFLLLGRCGGGETWQISKHQADVIQQWTGTIKMNKP